MDGKKQLHVTKADIISLNRIKKFFSKNRILKRNRILKIVNVPVPLWLNWSKRLITFFMLILLRTVRKIGMYCLLDIFISSHHRCYINKVFLEILRKSQLKHLCQSLFFDKVAGLSQNTFFIAHVETTVSLNWLIHFKNVYFVYQRGI